MSTLVRWGLVEAWRKNVLVQSGQLKTSTRWEWPKNTTFYVSKACLELENVFECSFDASPSKVFGVPKRRYPWPNVFVLMPFADALKSVYEDHIVKVVKAKDFTVGRADDFFTNGLIIADIWAAIKAATLIIADCTGRNPNVFYEIGLAHSLGRETILISRTLDDIPFDLRQLRVIIYQENPRGMARLEVALGETITNISGHRARHRISEENNAPPQTVTAGSDGWTRCPGCGFRFDSRKEQFYASGRHRRCGQRLTIINREPSADQTA
jgi:hypothetical protein